MLSTSDAQIEFEWILRHRLPDILSRILEHLNNSLQVSAKDKKQTLAVTAPNNDMVKGVVTLDGSALVKGELNLKLPHYNRSQALKVSLSPSIIYPLHQLESFRHCLHLAVSQVEAMQSMLLEDDGAGGVECTWIVNQFLAVQKIVQEGVKILCVVDEEKLFPIREGDGKFFAPELAEDLIVEFYMAGMSSLAISIYAIAYHQNGIPLQIQSQIMSRFKNTKIETYKGKPIEILDEVYLESKIPNFAGLEKEVQGAIGLCESVVGLLEALR
ncbi:hypothetical protein BCR33DRAFT_857096 [Rhizoclosmatium globosum]|uniref:RAVE subunit 2/Rogdi n=1 Tax=Rhizoclosmatium globosum TaxID=329046 RepID=A0A1Y2B8I0_9FUNG|nr:hypothetical protein HDU79_003829 [Rhizoclosmatium sp. JEL0117]ORY31132.1 hypothetical protein BCR33DRAFT_857096 [Rhizoclosmatium globosum]|eukprot:ORY31132.1 hypothetical protein BCR33DRAFT_857096 [Rhizoclosmatium globosum]